MSIPERTGPKYPGTCDFTSEPGEDGKRWWEVRADNNMEQAEGEGGLPVSTPQVGIPEGNDDPGPSALIASNPHLGSRDMRDLLVEFGVDGITATELTQARRDAEWRESGQR